MPHSPLFAALPNLITMSRLVMVPVTIVMIADREWMVALISIYVSLAVVGAVPASIAIVVVSRDIMIMGAVVVSWVMDKPVQIRPLMVSKLNTTGQIAFAGLVLAAKAFEWSLGYWFGMALVTVATLTVVSGAAYLAQWYRHMSA